jgi:hypothetical protein
VDWTQHHERIETALDVGLCGVARADDFNVLVDLYVASGGKTVFVLKVPAGQVYKAAAIGMIQ